MFYSPLLLTLAGEAPEPSDDFEAVGIGAPEYVGEKNVVTDMIGEGVGTPVYRQPFTEITVDMVGEGIGHPIFQEPFDNDWEVVWEASRVDPFNTASISGTAYRNVIDFTSLKNTNRNRWRLVFAAASSGEGMGLVENAYVGNHLPGGNPTQASPSLTPLTYDGGKSDVVVPVNTEFTTDDAFFAYIAGRNLLATLRVSGTANDDLGRFVEPDAAAYWRNGGFHDDANPAFLGGPGGVAALVRVEAKFSEEWNAVANPGLSGGGVSSGWNNYTIRGRMLASVVEKSGSKFRIRINATSGSQFEVTAAYVGHQAAEGHAYDFAATPTPITFDSNPGTGTLAAGTGIWSDWIDFPFVEGGSENIVFSFKLGNNSSLPGRSGLATGWNFYYKNADDAATVDATGYTTYNNQLIIAAIEVFDDDFGALDPQNDGDAGSEPEPDPEPDPGEWDELFAELTGVRSAVGGFSGRTTRCQVRAGAIANTGNTIKVLYYGGEGGLQIDAAYVGVQAGGSKPMQFASAPTQITFDSSATAFVPAGEWLESDEISFAVTGSDDLVFSLYSSSDHPFWSRPHTSGVFGGHGQPSQGNTAALVPGVGYIGGEAGTVVYGLRKVLVTTL